MSDEATPKILTLQDIRSAADLPRELVPVPEWGGAVVVQGVSVSDGMNLLKNMQDKDGKIEDEKAMLYAFVYGVVDPKFMPEDVEWLKTKALGAVTRVTQVFMRLSGFEQDSLKAARKNS